MIICIVIQSILLPVNVDVTSHSHLLASSERQMTIPTNWQIGAKVICLPMFGFDQKMQKFKLKIESVETRGYRAL